MNKINLNEPSVALCNGHILSISNPNKLHFASLYLDENNDLVKPLKMKYNNNSFIGYKYLHRDDQYLFPCQKNNKMGYAKVRMSSSPLSLPIEEEIHILNSHPDAEHYLDIVYSN